VAGQSGTSCGTRAGTCWETRTGTRCGAPTETRTGSRRGDLVPGVEAGPRTGTSCRTSCGSRSGTRLLVAGLGEVLKGNSRVNIEQRRRVQHLEIFWILRVPVRPNRRDSVSGFFSFFSVIFFLCTLPNIYK
jgi:hypothetical protein